MSLFPGPISNIETLVTIHFVRSPLFYQQRLLSSNTYDTYFVRLLTKGISSPSVQTYLILRILQSYLTYGLTSLTYGDFYFMFWFIESYLQYVIFPSKVYNCATPLYSIKNLLFWHLVVEEPIKRSYPFHFKDFKGTVCVCFTLDFLCDIVLDRFQCYVSLLTRPLVWVSTEVSGKRRW